MIRTLSLCFLLLLGQVSCAFAIMDEVHEAFDQKRFAKAFELLKPLAEKGYGEAQYELAKLYLEGKGTEPDEAAGLMWMRRAADRAWLDARYEMAELAMRTGDYAEAVKWLDKAIEKGHAGSHYLLGMMYLSGTGMQKDPKAGWKLIGEAARLGHAKALYKMGLQYPPSHTSSREDVLKIMYWFKEAAESAIKELDSR
jgi:uncharacterized protein